MTYKDISNKIANIRFNAASMLANGVKDMLNADLTEAAKIKNIKWIYKEYEEDMLEAETLETFSKIFLNENKVKYRAIFEAAANEEPFDFIAACNIDEYFFNYIKNKYDNLKSIMFTIKYYDSNYEELKA